MMLRYVVGQLVRRWGRSLILVLGVLVAVSSFVVLTTKGTSSRLSVLGTVSKQRGAYDILVRAKGSVSTVEQRQDLVRPNFLSETYGGISFAQWHEIQRLTGIDVAAPIATVGSLAIDGYVDFNLARVLPRGSRAVLTMKTDWSYDRGLSHVTAPTRTLYVTPNQIYQKSGYDSGNVHVPVKYYEQLPSGRRVEMCPKVFDQCYTWSHMHSGIGESGPATDVYIDFPISYTLAGVDPASEARLVHLNRAIASGHYLRNTTVKPQPEGGTTTGVIPVLMDPHAPTDMSLHVSVTKGGSGATLYGNSFSFSEALGNWIADATSNSHGSGTLPAIYDIVTAGPTRYQKSKDHRLHPIPVNNSEASWPHESGLPIIPPDGKDTQFRHLNPPKTQLPNVITRASVAGLFDADRLPRYNAASRVSLETYVAPALSGADQRSRTLLGGQPLLPEVSPASYVQQPALMLTTMAAVRYLAEQGYLPPKQARAPISGIRVKVAGVTGADPVSRERVRLVAEQIAEKTGLRVDIVLGSSPSAQTVALPAGKNGRPALDLTEWWSKKNVVATIVSAVERKSVALFVLVLCVCGLFVVNAAASAVRSRRTELGVLACLGWGRSRLFAAVLAELVILGLVAGGVGIAVAWGAGEALGARVSWRRAALAVPLAVALAVLAGLVPAHLASRAEPMAAVRSAAQLGRRARIGQSGVAGLVWANLTRVKARTVLGASALAVAAAAMTLIVSIQVGFRGTVVGSVLGDAVSVQVRGADKVAVAAMVILALVAVCDVSYLNVRDRAREFALLRATGWPDRTLGRLVSGEGAALGIIGAAVGAVIGVGCALVLADSHKTGELVLLGLAVVVTDVALATCATILPIVMLRHLPTAQLLAEE